MIQYSEKPAINREATAYWMPACAGMTLRVARGLKAPIEQETTRTRRKVTMTDASRRRFLALAGSLPLAASLGTTPLLGPASVGPVRDSLAPGTGPVPPSQPATQIANINTVAALLMLASHKSARTIAAPTAVSRPRPRRPPLTFAPRSALAGLGQAAETPVCSWGKEIFRDGQVISDRRSGSGWAVA
jgi:hypothetical protein